jgi:hypothetical protein
MVLFLPPMLEALYQLITTISQLQPLNRINAVFQALRLRNLWDSLPQYFFTANLYAPARKPATDLLTSLAANTNDIGDELGGLNGLFGLGIGLPHAALVLAGYSVIFAVLLYFSFLRRDVD